MIRLHDRSISMASSAWAAIGLLAARSGGLLILGANFGNEQGAGEALIDDLNAIAAKWSDTVGAATCSSLLVIGIDKHGYAGTLGLSFTLISKRLRATHAADIIGLGTSGDCDCRIDRPSRRRY